MIGRGFFLTQRYSDIAFFNQLARIAISDIQINPSWARMVCASDLTKITKSFHGSWMSFLAITYD